MEQDQIHDEDVSSPTLQTLKTMERSWTGGSNESVQQWIDSLTEADFNNVLEERLLTPPRITGQYSDVFLLPVPNGLDDDELGLGAEAKSLSRTSSLQGLSPRVSPLAVDSPEPVFPQCVSFDDVDCIEEETKHEEKAKEDDVPERQEEFDMSATRPETNNEVENKEVCDNGKSSWKSVSLTSVHSISSLLSAMENDPEEILRSLGFDDGYALPPLHRVPLRFFENSSEARGINPQKIYCDITAAQKEASYNAYDENTSKLLSRFSQSSIDLSCGDFDDLNQTKVRRSRMLDLIPSITVESDSCDTPVSDKNPQSRGSGSWRLSTVIEEIEPWSRKSSFSKSEKRFQLRKQSNVVDDSQNGDATDVRAMENGEKQISNFQDEVFDQDITEKTLRHTVARLEHFLENSRDEYASDSEANESVKPSNCNDNGYCGIEPSTANASKDLTPLQVTKFDNYLKSFHASDEKPGFCNASTVEDVAENSGSFAKEAPSPRTQSIRRTKTQSSLMRRRMLSNTNLAPKSLSISLPCSMEKLHEATARSINALDNGSCSVDDIMKRNLVLASESCEAKNMESCTSRRIPGCASFVNEKENFENKTDKQKIMYKDSDSEKYTRNEHDRNNNNTDRNDVMVSSMLSVDDVTCNSKKATSNATEFPSDPDTFIRQFSTDSLEAEAGSNQIDDSNNNNDDNNQVKRPDIEDETNDGNACKIRGKEFDEKPVRLVYRTLGKIENPRVTTTKDEDFSSNDTGIAEKCDKKVRRWSGLLGLSTRKKSDPFISKSSSHSDLSSKPDEDHSTEIPKMTNSSKIRDYLRRLTGNNMRAFFSMENLNTKASEESSNQSISKKFVADGIKDRVVEGDDGNVMNFHIHEIIEHQNHDLQFRSQSLQDIYSVPKRAPGFFILNRLRNVVKTRKLSPPHMTWDTNNDLNKKAHQVSFDDYNQIHQLGKKCFKTAHCEEDDVMTQENRDQNINIDPDFIKEQNKRVQMTAEESSKLDQKARTESLVDKQYSVDYPKGSENDADYEKTLNSKYSQPCGNLMDHSLGDMSAISERLNTEAKSFMNRDKSKRAALMKGYSIESSGFEDEAETCQSSPDRGLACSETGKRQLLNEYMEDKLDKPILEKSISSASGASQTISRDSLERQSSQDANEAYSKGAGNSNRKIVDDLRISNQPLCGSPVDTNLMDKRQFDYIVNQITSLRKELHEQEERIKCYIDDGLERIKASILTELSISNASERLKPDEMLKKSLDVYHSEL